MGVDIVALVSVIGITCSGVLATLFTSRCIHVSVCWGCIDCERKLKDEHDTDIEEKDNHNDVVVAREVNRDEVSHA